jgi:hypothetical protein
MVELCSLREEGIVWLLSSINTTSVLLLYASNTPRRVHKSKLSTSNATAGPLDPAKLSMTYVERSRLWVCLDVQWRYRVDMHVYTEPNPLDIHNPTGYGGTTPLRIGWGVQLVQSRSRYLYLLYLPTISWDVCEVFSRFCGVGETGETHGFGDGGVNIRSSE